MSGLVSIIVPVYNVEGFIEKSLYSIIRQEYKNLDIVVVDDGSTDGSGRICDEFSKKDARVRVFHKKNGGLSDARNFGIKKAKGDLIAFVDSDDFIKKNYVSEMYRNMNRSGSDMVVCGYNDINLKDEVLCGDSVVIRILTEQKNMDIVTWNKLYKKKLFVDNSIYFPEGRNHEDALTTYKLASKAKKVSYISKSLYIYIKRDNSIMGSEDIEERLKAREASAEEAVEYFEQNKKLRQAAEISLLLSKYAFLDFAIAGKINKKYSKSARKWIKVHRGDYKRNKYLTLKLKFYNFMSTNFGGVLYIIFRKIRHE